MPTHYYYAPTFSSKRHIDGLKARKQNVFKRKNARQTIVQVNVAPLRASDHVGVFIFIATSGASFSRFYSEAL